MHSGWEVGEEGMGRSVREYHEGSCDATFEYLDCGCGFVMQHI